MLHAVFHVVLHAVLHLVPHAVFHVVFHSVQVLNEDAHVTHHKYPGSHWSNTASLLNKHRDDYDQGGSAGGDHPHGYGSVFTNTHVFEVPPLASHC